MKKMLVLFGAVLFLIGFSINASAYSYTSYWGTDDGVSVSGPFTGSATAESMFLAGAASKGPIETLTFEAATVGSSSFTTTSGVTVQNNPVGYSQFGGVNDYNWGNLYGFNVTPSGKNWFGGVGSDAPNGEIDFTFTTPTNSFGTYFTGIQDVFSGEFSITLSDGTTTKIKKLGINEEGGVSYFGIIGDMPIVSVKIYDAGTTSGTDAWGIDNVTYNVATPIPGALLLLGPGLIGLAGIRRRMSR